jgi:hypothetical protein
MNQVNAFFYIFLKRLHLEQKQMRKKGGKGHLKDLFLASILHIAFHY